VVESPYGLRCRQDVGPRDCHLLSYSFECVRTFTMDCAGSRCDEGTAGSRWIAVAELGALAGEFVFKWVAADDDEPVEGRLAGVEGNIAEGR